MIGLVLLVLWLARIDAKGALLNIAFEVIVAGTARKRQARFIADKSLPVRLWYKSFFGNSVRSLVHASFLIITEIRKNMCILI